MGIRRITDGRWVIVARVRVGGKIRQKQETVGCSKEEAKSRFERMKTEMRTDASALPDYRASSLKLKTFAEHIDYFVERKGYCGMESKFRTLRSDLGPVAIDELGPRFDKYLMLRRKTPCARTGEPPKPATINRLIAVAKMVCSFAIKNELLDKNPIKRFEMAPEDPRDRVLTPQEIARLLGALKTEGSYLYWPVRFSLMNPIRRGDLFGLTRDNYDMVNNWVHFYASKTRRRRNRETCLVCIDEPMRQYFLSLPKDCPYLFARPTQSGWRQVVEFKDHWLRVQADVGIEDYRWHDLKHNAVTWMRDAGFSELDFENLGIQYTREMIQRYYKHDAQKAVAKWRDMVKCEHECEDQGLKLAQNS